MKHQYGCVALEMRAHIRATFLHMWNRIFRDSEHLKDVAAERALHLVEIDVGELCALDLLGGVVD